MKRRFGWVLNLDAELELARGRPGYVAQRKLLAQLAVHGAGARALLGPEDQEVGVGDGPPSFTPRETAPDFVGRAWCPTPLALAQLRLCGIEPEPHPSAAVLRRANHRLFAHELGGGLPGQAYVTSRVGLLETLGSYAQHWLLKRPLTFAGRGQLRALGPLTEKQWTWVDASFERDGLIVEPLVQPSFEVSLHGFVWRDGHYELGRVCAQDVSERGTFRAVRLAQPDELSEVEAAALGERAQSVAAALYRAGYFGPFGVDAYRYRRGEDRGFCALSEINARYTLGFATGFPRHPSELSLE